MLFFHKDEYGATLATPIKYSIVSFDTYFGAAIIGTTLHNGYISNDGLLALSLVDGLNKLPAKCQFSSEQEAQEACNKHHRNYTTK